MAASRNGLSQASYPDLAGKRVFVTGGSQGIGKAIALAFARNGAKVAIASRTKAKLDMVVQEMGGGYSIVADLTSIEECQRATKEAVEALGGVDIVVNNGAPTTEKMAEDPEAPSAYLAAFELHVMAAVAIIQEALPQLKANKGKVINISSIAAEIPMPDFAPYSVVKAALDSLTRVYALKYAKDGVRFNSVQSGATLTAAIEGMAKSAGVPLETMVANLGSNHAIPRISQPEEQAAIVLFLASEASSFVTGDSIAAGAGAQLGFWFNATHKQTPSET